LVQLQEAFKTYKSDSKSQFISGDRLRTNVELLYGYNVFNSILVWEVMQGYDLRQIVDLTRDFIWMHLSDLVVIVIVVENKHLSVLYRKPVCFTRGTKIVVLHKRRLRARLAEIYHNVHVRVDLFVT